VGPDPAPLEDIGWQQNFAADGTSARHGTGIKAHARIHPRVGAQPLHDRFAHFCIGNG
jgi:hypothetical protein